MAVKDRESRIRPSSASGSFTLPTAAYSKPSPRAGRARPAAVARAGITGSDYLDSQLEQQPADLAASTRPEPFVAGHFSKTTIELEYPDAVR